LDHPLDDPIWNALTTEHATLSVGEGRVRRYRPDVAPFISAQAEADLATAGPLIRQGSPSAMFRLLPLSPIDGVEIPASRPLDQMVAQGEVPAPSGTARIEPLTDDDVPEMMALVALTRPGPFLPRTIEMGRYFGIRDGGRLVALAGERMRLTGYVEVSAICTHPDARGRGLARQLLSTLARDVIEGGNTPFLHVLPENVAAKALYAELGFVHRQTFDLYLFGALALSA
jgi:ribosomal protein S18 acetylase RimI-like enzyme